MFSVTSAIIPRPDRGPHDMHNALAVEDILHLIFRHLSKRYVLRAARVNATWSRVALDVAWSNTGDSGFKRILCLLPGYTRGNVGRFNR